MTYHHSNINPCVIHQPIPEPEPERSPPLWKIGLAVVLFVGSVLFLDFLRFTYA